MSTLTGSKQQMRTCCRQQKGGVFCGPVLSRGAFLLACALALVRTDVKAIDLTDYGAVPALVKAPQDQSAANEKLDFHTDLFTGRFGYQVPIIAPPARQGTQPSVALQYSSANKNGWCGVGWDLDMGS